MNNKIKKSLESRNILKVILILAPQILAFALAFDIYAPSIPAIQKVFSASQFTMQLTVSAFVLTAGFGQLIFGPVSDQVGRRKVLLISILLYIIGSTLCVLAPNIVFLIFARIVQAFGACGMMVTLFAIVRDLYSGDECARIYSFLNSTVALSPLLAPLIGGYLAYWINWRAGFAFLTLIAGLIFISAKININETLAEKNRRNLKKELWIDYVQVLKNKTFLIYTFCAAAGFAGFLTFFSSSSYIIIDLLKIPEQHFGFYFASIGVVFFIGSLISGYSAKQIGTYRSVIFGSILMMLSGIVMFYWYLNFGLSISAFMIPMMLMGIGGAFTMGAGAGGAISPFPEMAGTASALFGCLEFIFAFFVSQIVMEWKVQSTLPLAYTLSILGLLSLIVMIMGFKLLQKPKYEYS